MPGENDERVLFGMDAEQADKMRQKIIDDPKYERDALNWIETLTGEQLTDAYTSLKFTQVQSQELFDVGDLHNKKSINAVIVNIYALGRAVQTLEGFSGPVLGVRYSVTIEDQQKRKTIKEEARKREQEQYEAYEQERKKRREFLEEDKAKRRLKREDTDRERIKSRRMKKGRRVSNSHRKSGGFGGTSPVKFGMDYEHQKAIEERQLEADPEHEEAALDWIEEMIGIELDDIYRSLRTGVVLCQLANAIEPGIIPKISTKDLPAIHRENIQLYLNACAKWGIPTHELFTVPDLYERKMISSVVVNIYAVARLVMTKKSRVSTPTLVTRNGKSMVVSRKDIPTENNAILKDPSMSKIPANETRRNSKRLSRALDNEETPLVIPEEPKKRGCCSCTIL